MKTIQEKVNGHQTIPRNSTIEMTQSHPTVLCLIFNLAIQIGKLKVLLRSFRGCYGDRNQRVE